MKTFPNELEPVLAKISHQNDLGSPQWYEVVYYIDGKWCSYSDSDTFEDGEQVVEWKYCSEIFNIQEQRGWTGVGSPTGTLALSGSIKVGSLINKKNNEK